ncbi:MAG TPA: nucleotide sugar dehydrogenase, partial [Gemmataceae bacterium]|nr:nucleotide sugar dehydrogenase [Gemmataceae bacterium]
MILSVVGLGKLGSPMAACFAAKGFKVIGVDLVERNVRLINEGKAPVFEPGLQDMLDRSGGRLSATGDLYQAACQADVLFVIVPTPSDPSGAFTPRYVLEAMRPIGEAIRGRHDCPIVVVTSTVMPGCTGTQVKPLLEEVSGKRCGTDFGLCYSPEFIALGSVIRDFLNPDLLLIGESDARTGERVTSLYAQVCDTKPRVARMSFANAELTKLAVNAFVTTKISYANMLAEICERIEGGDVDAVTGALGLDTRIGAKYLKGSIGFGGPCFPRDNVALMTLAGRLGVDTPLPVATDTVNNHQVSRLAHLAEQHLPPGGTLGVLGLSYKPHTNVIEKAQGLEIAAKFARGGASVTVYDPCALDAARGVLPGSVHFAASASECARRADVLLVCTPSAEYKAVGAADLKRPAGRRAVVIDCWRMLDRAAISQVADYL